MERIWADVVVRLRPKSKAKKPFAIRTTKTFIAAAHRVGVEVQTNFANVTVAWITPKQKIKSNALLNISDYYIIVLNILCYNI